jgi:hypothetical protein
MMPKKTEQKIDQTIGLSPSQQLKSLLKVIFPDEDAVLSDAIDRLET